tara:strand:+ start:2496 stop:2837 length:342 start_codon:yes stop_codon:yes gene_type:complete
MSAFEVLMARTDHGATISEDDLAHFFGLPATNLKRRVNLEVRELRDHGPLLARVEGNPPRRCRYLNQKQVLTLLPRLSTPTAKQVLREYIAFLVANTPRGFLGQSLGFTEAPL